MLLAYFVATDGRAASHHVDDRLAPLAARGVELTVVSSPRGGAVDVPGVRRLRAWSVTPRALVDELRANGRQDRGGPVLARFLRQGARLALALACLPLVPLEKRLARRDQRRSWRLDAVRRARAHARRDPNGPPELVWTVGGPAAAHEAGLAIARRWSVPLVCQFQDPLEFQYPAHKGSAIHRHHERLEATLAAEAAALVFLTESAARAARARLGPGARVLTIRPGAPPRARADRPRRCRPPGDASGSARAVTFAHVGTLGGARNLDALLDALDRVGAAGPERLARLRLRLAGRLDASVRRAIDASAHARRIERLGRLPRALADAVLDGADVLLLIQHRDPVSAVTIPSKTYEYLQRGAPVLALVHGNAELASLLREHGHAVHDLGEDPLAPDGLDATLAALLDGRARIAPVPCALTTAASVDRLVAELDRIVAGARDASDPRAPEPPRPPPRPDAAS